MSRGRARAGVRPPSRRRRALVTGGGVRVGRAIAEYLGRSGYDVVVHYHGSAAGAEAVAAGIVDTGGVGVALQADLMQPEAAEGLPRRAAELLGGIDLLVNSAAIFPRGRPETVTLEEWSRVFDLNLRAPFLCSRAAVECFEEGGSIVNIADVAAFEAWPGLAPYAATKAGLVSLTRSLALAWAPRIRVNCVAPGPVLLPEGTSEEERDWIVRGTALGRIGEPEEVARAVHYLDSASFVTGEVVRVDGGEHLRRALPLE